MPTKKTRKELLALRASKLYNLNNEELAYCLALILNHKPDNLRFMCQFLKGMIDDMGAA